MKFSISIIAGLAGFALAQSSSSSSSSTGGSSTTTAGTPTTTCLSKCASGDVNCQAACLGNPYPNPAQISQTAECSAKCNQGDGSPSQTQQYADCLASCRASYFLSTGTNFVGGSTANSGAAATGASGSGSAPAGSSATPTATGSGAQSSSSGSQTASGAQASSSKGAAVALNAPYAGAAGLLLAALAL
ncbi:hypothetical protein K461DRAFT_266125 [Myriangium duriaei CBS 260.36]|uniref:Uncharacterized protein n=1 Tax=Myriangium duriaei CBS 260.36 TaxID=1168546 RepID=A0A9P4MJ08_9PEZI|nr:hypothetical protein K461DRAFT_266125 [Myriangium duriaei CBS 260.36]